MCILCGTRKGAPRQGALPDPWVSRAKCIMQDQACAGQKLKSPRVYNCSVKALRFEALSPFGVACRSPASLEAEQMASHTLLTCTSSRQ